MQPMPTPWKRKLRNLLFIDLKTVTAEATYDRLTPRMRNLWDQKINTFRRDQDWTAGEWYEQRASLHAEFGKIACIGIGGLYFDEADAPFLKVKTIADHDERSILLEVSEIIGKYLQNDLTLCAHNGKEFDYPYLCRRLLRHELPLPPALQLSGRKPWDIPHQDTLERWQFGDKRHFIPLDLLAAALDIPGEPLPWTGEQTSVVYHQERNLDKIRDHARESIVMLTQVYLRMLGAPSVDADKITRLE
jgi:3'-5' exonuclease